MLCPVEYSIHWRFHALFIQILKTCRTCRLSVLGSYCVYIRYINLNLDWSGCIIKPLTAILLIKIEVIFVLLLIYWNIVLIICAGDVIWTHWSLKWSVSHIICYTLHIYDRLIRPTKTFERGQQKEISFDNERWGQRSPSSGRDIYYFLVDVFMNKRDSGLFAMLTRCVKN